MFDIAKAISASTDNNPHQQGPSGCSLFYQSEACKALLEEVFRYEGWLQPVSESIDIETLNSAVLPELIILELTKSGDVITEARAFSHRLPNHKGIIVIGEENAMTTLRALKEMGLYYLFWPVSKHEIADFIRHVHNNISRFVGVSQNRKAKKIAVIGSKGGVGTTLISAEIAAKLASQGVNTVLVDHQYCYSNMDIILGQKDFQKHHAESLGLPFYDLSEASAVDYLQTISPNLRMLALSGDQATTELVDYNLSIIDLLQRHANVIIEDYSTSLDFKVDLPLLVKRCDTLVIVIEPSVASVRNARAMIDAITPASLDGERDVRLFLLVNMHRPDNYFPLTSSDIAGHLQRHIDVTLPYSRHSATLLLQGKRLYKDCAAMAGPFTEICKLLSGERVDASMNQGPVARLLSWVRR